MCFFSNGSRLARLPLLLFSGVAFVSQCSAWEGSPIAKRLEAARESAVKKPVASSYNELAQVLMRRARETDDQRMCAEGGRVVERSLAAEPQNFEARRTRVTVLLCEKRWSDALEQATTLNQKVPDDVAMWGYIADAQMGLGNYAAAEKAAQWMIDMRQVNPQGLQRGAELREIFGFNDAAVEWWSSALRLTSATDLEERAWITTRIARVQRIVGHLDDAERNAAGALSLVDDYPWALDELGRSALQRKSYDRAIERFTRRLQVADSPSVRYELGLALDRAGRHEEALKVWTEFEKQALACAGLPANADVALIRYYAGPGKKPTEAIRISKLLLQSRHDIEIRAAYATALAANGDWKAAGEQMALALEPGVKDPEWLLQAGTISREAGDAEGAKHYFQAALEAGPASPLAGRIIEALTTLAPTARRE